MSLFFLGVLRLDEETLASYEVTSKPYRTSDISRELTRIACHHRGVTLRATELKSANRISISLRIDNGDELYL